MYGHIDSSVLSHCESVGSQEFQTVKDSSSTRVDVGIDADSLILVRRLE
jgi:hypothetical protein